MKRSSTLEKKGDVVTLMTEACDTKKSMKWTTDLKQSG
jgi:hypothetical protein